MKHLTIKKLCFLSALIASMAVARDDVPEVPPGVRAPVDTLFHEPLTRGIDLVYADEFGRGFQLFDSLISKHPSHPAPYFYKAATYQAWMSSYRINTFQKDLEENIERAINSGNEMLKLRKDDPWINFYVGAAYGYRAFYRMRSWNWIGAYMDGRKGIGNFKKALEKEETLYDVYLGLGTYHYWRTARSRFLAALAFWWRDKRDEGIEQMRFSIDHGQYCPPEAAMALIISLIDYERFVEAQEALDAFNMVHAPEIMSKVYLSGRIAAHFQRWEEVDTHFEDLMRRLEASQYPSPGYQVECKYWLATSAVNQGNKTLGRQLVEEALAQAELRDKDAELEGPFEGFDHFRDRLKEMQKELVPATESAAN